MAPKKPLKSLRSKKKSCEKILKNLETIYEIALQENNFTVALKALELLGKEAGLFSKTPSDVLPSKKLSEMSEEELRTLLGDS